MDNFADLGWPLGHEMRSKESGDSTAPVTTANGATGAVDNSVHKPGFSQHRLGELLGQEIKFSGGV